MLRLTNKGRQALPVVLDTLEARNLRTSHIERENHDGPFTGHRQHLLSPWHQRRMKELPY